MRLLKLISLIAIFFSTPAIANQVFGNDVVIRNTLLCVGTGCDEDEPDFTNFMQGILLDSPVPTIIFEDTSSSTGKATTDWRLLGNESIGGRDELEQFYLSNLDAKVDPFIVKGDAGHNALVVGDFSRIGLGTALPESKLHLVASFPNIFLESTGFSSGKWSVAADGSAFAVADIVGGTIPLQMAANAPTGSIYSSSTGDLGFGTNVPEGKLHAKGDGVQLVYFESGDGGPVQVRFRTDSENRRFLAVDNDNNVKSQIIFLDDRINFTGQTDSGANLWLSIGPDGIISQGPTCGSPCDLTFDPEVFSVPPIDVRAEYMWDNMHLPAIGPTNPDTPINLTEKTGGIIHELEVAHIYIEQLHQKIARLEAEKAESEAAQEAKFAKVMARLDALEAQ